MKDKIIQIIDGGEMFRALTREGRILYMAPSGEWEELLVPSWILKIEDIPRFKFGKYRGEPISEADPEYLAWCREHIDGFRWVINEGKLEEEPLF